MYDGPKIDAIVPLQAQNAREDFDTMFQEQIAYWLSNASSSLDNILSSSDKGDESVQCLYSDFPGPIAINFKKCSIVRAQTHDRINIFRAISECLGKDKDEVIRDFYALNDYGSRSTRDWVTAFKFHVMGGDKKKILVNDNVCKSFDYIYVLY